jgi:signal transduction histidine kinase
MEIEANALLEALGGSTEAAAAALQHLPVGIARFARDGALRAHNAELARLLGAPPATAAAVELHAIAPAAPGEPQRPVERALAGTAVRDAELEWHRPDGGTRWVRLTAIPLPADGGALLLLSDLSEARGLDAIRQQALGVVAHDLRNPLSALRMTAAIMARPKEMPTERRVQLTERMLGSIGRMEGLVATLLDHARSEAGVELRLQREPVDLGGVLERVKKDLEVLFPGRPLQERTAGSLVGSWDRGRIERVLANLLSNAFKHGREDTPVSVELEGSAPDAVTIVVTNLGPPIAPELMPHVFEPFTIGPVGETGRRRSVGLGLFIVKHLVVAHGGSVSVRSSLEEGTTFTTVLPRERAAG